MIREAAEQYDLMDERVGVWTAIHEQADRVDVVLTAAHFRGRLLGLLMTLAAVFMMLSALVRYYWSPWIAVTAGLLGVFLSWKFVHLLTCSPRKLVLTIVDSSCERPDRLRESCIWSEAIEAVILRRNTGCKVEDMSKWQVYLRLAESPTPRLIYQEPYTNRGRKRALSVARNLASRWGAELIEPDKHTR